jgi:hypothetical protein
MTALTFRVSPSPGSVALSYDEWQVERKAMLCASHSEGTWLHSRPDLTNCPDFSLTVSQTIVAQATILAVSCPIHAQFVTFIIQLQPLKLLQTI